MATYYELNTYSNTKAGKVMSLAYKERENAVRSLKREFDKEKESKRWGQILSLTPILDAEGLVGYEEKCRGDYEYVVKLEEAEGNIAKLSAKDRFSD